MCPFTLKYTVSRKLQPLQRGMQATPALKRLEADQLQHSYSYFWNDGSMQN